MFSLNTFKSSKPWTNWAGNVISTPLERKLPNSLDEVSEIIKRAKGSTIRVTGAAHSFSSIAKPDEIALSLHNLRGLVSIDSTKQEATFLAGTYLFEVGPILAKHQLALQNMGDIQYQTLAGAICTGTHGTGIGLGSLSEQVVAWKWIDGIGELHTHRRGNDELSKALHLSLGLLGIIVEVTLKVIPVYGLRVESYHVPLFEGLQNWNKDQYENRHLEWFYFPGQEKVQVKKSNMIKAKPQTYTSKTTEFLKGNVVENYGFFFLSEWCKRNPKRTKWVTEFSAKNVPIGKKEGYSFEMFPTPRLVRFLETEYAVQHTQFQACMEEVHFHLKSHPFDVHFPIECRTTKGENAFLSPTQGEETAFMAFHMYKGMDETNYFKWVHELMEKYGGRPHFGKMNVLTTDKLHTLYPSLNTFIKIRESYDEHNLFLSNYFKQLFSVK
ncbi:D-arabinono-1,4-lactone oxidase [Psychrobacillus vulpis]|uniref:FAD-binding protein n=1 Tax=Psychrobacillus vulpis TaxID=2325572 RepID=A0A544TPU8_9BACI|nr:D-arabinono-1,4-lactone oxidase [Psychrobacillus vulpis]TQR19481.1 FAD-binding protein [Psychrobacillus vulpis]